MYEGTCPALLDSLVCWLLGKEALIFHSAIPASDMGCLGVILPIQFALRMRLCLMMDAF